MKIIDLRMVHRPGTLEQPESQSMSMRAYIIRISLASCLMQLGWFAGEFPVLAAVEKPKKEMKWSLLQPLPSDRQMPVAKSKEKWKKPTKKGAHREKRPQVQSTRSDSGVRPQPGRKNGSTGQPTATIQPKPDLSYHGILEHPQRYDASLPRHKGRSHNPGTGDLLHDHFQELDKNRDGILDPFERALGRLDMDRDLSNRNWE